MGLFTPRWMNKDYSKAKKAVEKLRGEKKLLRVVLECRHSSLCYEACQKLQEDASLAAVLAGARNDKCRAYAAARITDAELLRPYLDDGTKLVKYRALRRLGHKKEAYALLEKEANWRGSESFVLEVVSQGELEKSDVFPLSKALGHRKVAELLLPKLSAKECQELMWKCPDSAMVPLAFRRCRPKDRQELLRYARTAACKYTRRDALGLVPRLTVAELVPFLEDEDMYDKACQLLSKVQNKKLKEEPPETLCALASLDPQYHVISREAIKELKDPELVWKALLQQNSPGDKGMQWLSCALDSLSQRPDLLFKLCVDDSLSVPVVFRKEAVMRLEKPEELYEIVLKGNPGWYEAAQRLPDSWKKRAVLEAGHGTKDLIRFINDPAILEELLPALSKREERELAAAKLQDTETILRLLREPKNSGIFFLLLKNLSDPALLRPLLEETKDEALWDRAARRLTELGTEEDVRRLILPHLDHPMRHDTVLWAMNKKCGMSWQQVLEQYGTEETVAYYLDQLKQARENVHANLPIETLKLLYQAGKGREAIGALNHKPLRGHVDKEYNYCTPGWGHGDGHDDRAPVYLEL